MAELPAASTGARAEAVRAALAPPLVNPPAGVATGAPSEAVAPGEPASSDVPHARAKRSRPAISGVTPPAAFSQNAALFLLWRSAIESGVLARAEEARAGGPLALARALAGRDRNPASDPAVGWLLRSERCETHDAPPLSLGDIRTEAIAAQRGILYTVDGELSCHVLADAATGAWLGVWREPPDSTFFGDCELIEPALATSLLPSRIADDLSGLRLAAGDPETVLAWAWLAERVMRDLARRIPGFAHASVAWLRANLLPTGALVDFRDEREIEILEVQFDPPPVGMLLRIAGLHATEYRLPGTARRSVRLRMTRG